MGLGVDNKSKLLSIGMIVTGALYIPIIFLLVMISSLFRNKKYNNIKFLLLILPLALISVYLYCTISLMKYYEKLKEKQPYRYCSRETESYCKIEDKSNGLLKSAIFPTITMVVLLVFSVVELKKTHD